MNYRGREYLGLNAEQWLMGVVPAIVLSGAPVSHVMGGDLTALGRAETSPVSSLVYGTLYLLVGWWIFQSGARVFRVASRNYLIWGIMGVALASILWSGRPEVTAAKSFGLLGSAAFGLLLATRFTLQEQIRILGVALGILCLLSIGMALAVPEYGLHDEEMRGAWRGVFSHKNNLGHLMSLATIVFAVEAASSDTHRSKWILAACVALVVTILSQSMTSCVCSVLIVAGMAGWRMAMRGGVRGKGAAALLLVAVLAGVVLLVICVGDLDATFDVLLDGIGRDRTLTGRSDLWEACWDKAQQRPLLGYGYGAFWLGFAGPSADIWDLIPWQPPTAHNGLLDLALQLGIVGLVVYGAGYLRVWAGAVRMASSSCGWHAMWGAAFLVYLAMSCVTESGLLAANSVDWSYYVACALTVTGAGVAQPQRLDARQCGLKTVLGGVPGSRSGA